jgi:hypothetical protein
VYNSWLRLPSNNKLHPGQEEEAEEGDEAAAMEKRRKQRQVKSHKKGDEDKTLCTSEKELKSLQLDVDKSLYVLDTRMFEKQGVESNCVQQCYVYSGTVYGALVLGDVNPAQLFKDLTVKEADPGLDLSLLLPSLEATLASLPACGSEPFPLLKQWECSTADPFQELLMTAVAKQSEEFVGVPCF